MEFREARENLIQLKMPLSPHVMSLSVMSLNSKIVNNELHIIMLKP